ncbi:hypothetical protein I3W98_33785, partial [Streptomyces cavourensis]|nr:hypothetical protein [Streptomyces cavourensis]
TRPPAAARSRRRRRPSTGLPAGTRLRAEIAGHHFPAHARNPHTGENPVTATRLAPSRRAVTARGSALHLTVVARRHYVEPVPEICR